MRDKAAKYVIDYTQRTGDISVFIIDFLWKIRPLYLLNLFQYITFESAQFLEQNNRQIFLEAANLRGWIDIR